MFKFNKRRNTGKGQSACGDRIIQLLALIQTGPGGEGAAKDTHRIQQSEQIIAGRCQTGWLAREILLLVARLGCRLGVLELRCTSFFTSLSSGACSTVSPVQLGPEHLFELAVGRECGVDDGGEEETQRQVQAAGQLRPQQRGQLPVTVNVKYLYSKHCNMVARF